jgi:hypothetical protein
MKPRNRHSGAISVTSRVMNSLHPTTIGRIRVDSSKHRTTSQTGQSIWLCLSRRPVLGGLINEYHRAA